MLQRFCVKTPLLLSERFQRRERGHAATVALGDLAVLQMLLPSFQINCVFHCPVVPVCHQESQDDGAPWLHCSRSKWTSGVDCTRICTFLHIKAHKINTKPTDLFLMSTSKSRPQIGKSHEANQLSKLKCFDTN